MFNSKLKEQQNSIHGKKQVGFLTYLIMLSLVSSFCSAAKGTFSVTISCCSSY